MGPAVSCVEEIGMIPRRLTSPTVGLSPTSPQIDDGQRIDPSVSVPTPTAARLAAMAVPVPEEEPHGLRSMATGWRTCPPRLLHPLVERVERKLAHSLRLVFPSSTAPASRSRATRKASRGAGRPTSASEPAVVCIRSPVSMLSLMSTGIPCSGPRTRPCRRSASRAAAMASASGFTSITLRSVGPAASMAAMRARYARTSAREVVVPRVMRRCNSATPTSASANGGGAASSSSGNAHDAAEAAAAEAAAESEVARKSRRGTREDMGRAGEG